MTAPGALMRSDTFRLHRFLAATVLALPLAAAAQSYPSRPINVILPYALGGTTDVLARMLQDPLQKALGQPIVIEARTGASGLIGTRYVARSPADGYTLLFQTGAHVIVPHVSRNPGVDPLGDFEPVALVASQPFVLVTHPSVPARTVKEFIDFVRANPGKIDYGSSGASSFGRLATEQFMRMAGIDMVHIPYKGMGPITTAMVTGEVKAMISSTSPQVNQFVKEGRLNLLGVASPEPSPLVPGVEPIARTLPGYSAEVWFGFLAPKGTRLEIVTTLYRAIERSVAQPDVKARFESAGTGVALLAPDAFRARMQREHQAWGEIIRKLGISED